jgi:hypothetical protein
MWASSCPLNTPGLFPCSLLISNMATFAPREKTFPGYQDMLERSACVVIFHRKKRQGNHPLQQVVVDSRGAWLPMAAISELRFPAVQSGRS